MMRNRKQMTKRQLEVLEDLFEGELDERAVLDKHRVTNYIYDKWHKDESFSAEFERRMDALNRRGGLIIGRYAAMAAAKLVQLTGSKNQETARKACLDIMSLDSRAAGERKKRRQETRREEPDTRDDERRTMDELPPATAARLLAALAEEEKENTMGDGRGMMDEGR
jgi:hypothetical protein